MSMINNLINILTVQDRPDLKNCRLYQMTFYTGDPGFLYSGELEKNGFKYVDGFLNEPYCMTWVNSDELAVISYTEGDLSLLLCDDIMTFKQQVRDHVECLANQFDGAVMPDILKIYNDKAAV